jgi:hypothetical protein
MLFHDVQMDLLHGLSLEQDGRKSHHKMRL